MIPHMPKHFSDEVEVNYYDAGKRFVSISSTHNSDGACATISFFDGAGKVEELVVVNMNELRAIAAMFQNAWDAANGR